ncbi:MAG: hypothetical protein WAP55_02775 [Minisyncoccia bacterium]
METIVVVGLVGIAVLFIVVFAVHKSGIAGSQPIISFGNMPVAKASEPRWQVWFAGDWYECQLVGENGQWGQLVRMTDRRTHSRIISRPLNCVRQV